MGKFSKFSIIAAAFVSTLGFSQEVAKIGAIEVSSSVIEDESVDAYKVNVRNATLIKDVLRDVPGVYLGGTNGYNQKIYMRGMSDRAINVTIDGARQKGNTFHHNADLLLDPAIIKAVDAKVGVHSVVGTSGAMGGSVAFKTLDASDLLASGELVGARIGMGYASNNKEFSQGITLYGADEDRNFDVLGYFNHRGHDFGKDGKGKEMGGKGDGYNYMLKAGVKLGDYGRFKGSWEHMEYEGTYPLKAEWPGGINAKGERTLKDSKYFRDTYTLGYAYNPSEFIDLNVDAYHTEHRLDQTKSDEKGIKSGVKTYGLKTINKTKFDTAMLDHTFVYGFEYYHTSAYNKAKSNSVGIPNDEAKSASLFIEDQIRYGGLRVVPGIRYDHYKLDTLGGAKGDIWGRSEYSWDHFSPAFLVDFQSEFGLGAYASYARLFRGADVYEGIRINEANAKAAFDTDLKAETGDAYEAGLRYKAAISESSMINLSAKYFYTDYKNLIAEMSSPGSQYSTRINAGDARIRGFELAARYNYENLGLGVTYSKQDTKYNLSEIAKKAGRGGRSVYGSTLAYADTGDKITFNAEYFISPLDLFVGWNTIAFTSINEYKNNSDQKTNKPGYAVHDLYATWTPSSGKFDGLELNFGIYNIFDKTYASHSQRTLDIKSAKDSSIDFEEGRNVKLNLRYKF